MGQEMVFFAMGQFILRGGQLSREYLDQRLTVALILL